MILRILLPPSKLVWKWFVMQTLDTETSSLRDVKIMPRILNGNCTFINYSRPLQHMHESKAMHSSTVAYTNYVNIAFSTVETRQNVLGIARLIESVKIPHSFRQNSDRGKSANLWWKDLYGSQTSQFDLAFVSTIFTIYTFFLFLLLRNWIRPWGGFAAPQLLLELEVEPVLGTTWWEEEVRQLILEPVVLQSTPVYRSLLLLLYKSLTNIQILPGLLQKMKFIFIL